MVASRLPRDDFLLYAPERSRYTSVVMVDARRHVVAPQPFVSRKVVRGESPTHGAGVFAAEVIDKGEAIIVFKGPITHACETDFGDYHLQIGDDRYIGPSGDLDDLVNHCCEPNAGFHPASEIDAPLLIAKRVIAVGEEITMDYGAVIDEHGFEGFPCSCGVSSCRSIVTSFRHLSEVKKQALKPWVMPYLRDKYFR